VAIVVLANGAIWVGVAVARLLGHAPEVEGGMPEIENLRRIDERVYASGQPGAEDYEVLAERGFSVVIDLRAHVRSDPMVDDPDQLRSFGLDYVHVPVSDGRAPQDDEVERVLTAIDRADGKVLIHCGGGVGRSGALAASYLASQGVDPSVLEQLGVGPPTLEQIYYVAATGDDDPYAESGVVNVVSRYIVDGPRRLWHTISGI
jgi:uncharacterized protein (TIGR01244 family)